jgi:hypothetical protein
MPRPKGSKNTKPAGVRVNARVSAQVAEWLKSTGNITGTIEKLCEDEMNKNGYKLMHVGYPVSGRAIRTDEWKVLSVHASEGAAWKKFEKCTAHLGTSWDDHYILLGPDGEKCNYQEWLFNQRVERAIR